MTHEDQSEYVSLFRQGPFLRVFAGQLILLTLTIGAAAWIAAGFGLSVVFLAALVFVALAALSVVGPAVSIAAELRVDPAGIRAKRYFGRTWNCRWEDLECVLLFEMPTFGARYRLRLVSSTAGSIVVTNLVNDFEALLERVHRFAPTTPKCQPPSIIQRALSG
jgi:hypothetical protein